jgi:DNA repair exonuclease SbcCD ATPase subunit
MIPVKLTMKNFGPYEDSIVEFNFSSALITGENINIAGASNGTGKSTIFQALAWVLTGYSRYKNSASIIRDKTDSTKVTYDFIVGETLYRIVRGRNRSNKQTLDFLKVLEDGTTEPIKADTNSKLDDKISEITKIKYDSFLNTCYFAQNSISEFMYGSAAIRQKLIAEILDLDRWNIYAKKASTLLSEAENELDVLKFKINSVKQNEQKRAQLKATAEEAVGAADSARADLLLADYEVDRLVGIVAQESAGLSTKKARLDLLNDISSKDSSLSVLAARKYSVSQQLGLVFVPDLPIEPGHQPLDPTEISNKLADRKAELKYLSNRILAMQNGKCDNCGTKWDHNHDSELESLREAESDLRNRIAIGEKAYSDALEAGRVWRQAFSSYQQALTQRQAQLSKKDSLSASLEELETQEKSLLLECMKLKGRLNDFPETGADSDSSGFLAGARALQKQLSDQILAAESRKASAMAEASVIDTMMAEYGTMLERRKKLEELVGTYSVLAKHFGKTGIQANILDTVISEIETLANKFMSKLNYKPFSIRFVTQKPDTKGQIKETLDVEVITPDSVKYIEDLSGGEQFRVAFSVRLALATVQARRQGGEINILLLDEVSSSLDKVGLETFVSIIRELEKTMKVLLITHDDSLKEHFDTTIHVQNNGSTAKIVQK